MKQHVLLVSALSGQEMS